MKFNTYPIERFVIIDDSAKPLVFENIEKINDKFGKIFELHFNYEKLGQVRSIDKIYSTVNTDFIFHCEDDWLFYKPGFIEKSIDVLNFDEKIIQVIIRPKNDSYVTGFSNEILQTTSGIKYRKVVPTSYMVDPVINRWVRDYHGFTMNPGLRRLKEYKLLPSYTSISDENGPEEPLDIFYKNLGYYAVTICETNDDGYVRHNGWNRRTENHIW
jgi:hypothetical protein